MAISPQWRFILANSADLSHVGELQRASNRQLNLVFNRAGSFSFSLPLDDELAPYIWPITSSIKAYRRGSDGAWKLIWSGFVWTIEEDVSGNSMSVTAQGWLQWLEKRVLRRAKDYTGYHPTAVPQRYWYDSEIIHDLIADANTTPITWDNNYVLPTPYMVGTSSLKAAAPTPIGGTVRGAVVNGDFSTHTRRYTIQKYSSILSEIQRLTDIENGCDVLVDPTTRCLNVWAQKMADRPNALFSYGWGPSNLSQFGRSIDPSTTVNWLAALGDASIIPQYADTKFNPPPTQNPPKLGEDSMQTYGIVEEVASITEAKTSQILQTYAGAEVLLRSSPRLIYSMTPLPYTTTLGPGRIPEPFIDYDLGDKIYLSVRTKGRMLINRQGMRVSGIAVSPDDNGNEIIGQLQVSPA